ncbi:MAG: protein kinase [Gemmatimonadetes bacterium]|nr:protein kinase [Gemmatimonadota bacterium]
MSTGGTGRKLCPQCGTEYDSGTNFCPKDGSVLKADYGSVELVGQVIGGRYRIERKLGEGGMGQVYLAEHVKLGRACAIKIMRPALMRDQDAIGRFAREAATAGRISHPNVAAVYDFGETEDGLIYLAMEHVEGTPLSAVLASRGRLPPAEAVEIAAQVAAGLNAAHELSIIHRDLKPDNVLLSYGRDGRPVVKVVDFGIAKAIQEPGQNLTQTGMVVGTLEYMSPEQLIGEALDGRSDVYSLGCVLYEMLTGERTFGGSTGAALTRRLTEPPPHPRARVPEVPEALDAVVVRALARVAADRFATATELRDALLASIEAPAPAPTPPGAMPAAAPPAPATTPATATAPPATAPEASAATTPPAPVPAAAPASAVTPVPTGAPTAAGGAPIQSAPPAAPTATVTAPQAGPEPATAPPRRGWALRLATAAVVVAALAAGALMVRGRRTPAAAPPPASASAAAAPAGAASGEPAVAAASPAPVAADQPAQAAAAPPTTPASTTPTTPAAAAPARAELRITGSLPAGAVVMLDGVRVAGRTLSLEPGRHTVSVGASGYEMATWRGTLQPGENRSWTPDLRRVAEAAAPQPAGPVTPPPTLGNPAPPPRTDTAAPAPIAAPAAPALPGREALLAAGRRAAEAFVAAINARDIRQLRRAWPGIRSSEDDAWRRFLEAKENTSVEARLVTVKAEDVNAGTATVLFPIILTFTNPATGRQIQQPSFEATFLAAGDGWKLATIRPAQGN